MNTATSNGSATQAPSAGVIAPSREARASTVNADLIALLPDAASVRVCLDIAEDAVRSIGGRMAAAYVGADPEAMIAAPEEIDLQMLRDLDEGSPNERLERVKRAFEEWKLAKPERGAIRLDDCRGDLGRCVTSACHETALVVVPAHGNLDARDAFHDVLFNERKLVLVPPAGSYSGNLFRHVLIGWKPHAHARDAVVAARRWLVAAERVTVLCVNDMPDGNYQFTARELLDQLGVKGDVVAISSEGRPVGEAVLDFANSAHATCLLVGAFKHNYFLELLLGRVTRYLLAHATIPLMMKH
jgi:hypothetical protein